MNTRTLRSCILVALLLLLMPRVPFCSPVNEQEATVTAQLWLTMEINSSQSEVYQAERAERLAALQQYEVLYLVSEQELVTSHPASGPVLAYVVKYKRGGFVVVSGDDRILPVIAFDLKTNFRWDEPEQNFMRKFLGRNMVARWNALSGEPTSTETHPGWEYIQFKLRNGDLSAQTFDAPASPGIIRWRTALWGQGTYYNTEVVAHNGGITGIPTGCTATAMAIKMKFHEWPIVGYGSHSYSDIRGNVQYSHSANFGAHTYDWSQMPLTSLTAANSQVAWLMYHCGIAVNMDYEVGASGAWPNADETNTHFRYRGTTEKTSGHDTPTRDSVRGAAPVVLSSSSHTVCVCGYRDTLSPYYYINAGWNGGSNGWYNLDDIPGGDPTVDRSYPYSTPNNYCYVNSSWSGAEDGDLDTPYNSIIEGKTNVASSGRLWIKGGVYKCTCYL